MMQECGLWCGGVVGRIVAGLQAGSWLDDRGMIEM